MNVPIYMEACQLESLHTVGNSDNYRRSFYYCHMRDPIRFTDLMSQSSIWGYGSAAVIVRAVGTLRENTLFAFRGG